MGHRLRGRGGLRHLAHLTHHALSHRHHDVLVGGARLHDPGPTGVVIGREAALVEVSRQEEHDVRRGGHPLLSLCRLGGKGIGVAGIAAALQHVGEPRHLSRSALRRQRTHTSNPATFGRSSIGSGPGVPGASGRQNQPLLPSRSTTNLPASSSSLSRIVALAETVDGAALIAFSILACSVRVILTATAAPPGFADKNGISRIWQNTPREHSRGVAEPRLGITGHRCR